MPTTLVIGSTINKIQIEPYVSYFEDPTSIETISSIQSAEKLSQFRALPNPLINFGFTASTYWFKFTIHHPLDKLHTYLLEIDYPMLDDIIIFSMSEKDTVTVTPMGDLRPFNQRPLNVRNFITPIELSPHSTTHFFIRVNTTSNLAFPLKLWNQQSLVEHQFNHQWVNGIFYGIAFGMLVYNIFLFISIREKAFFFYLIHAVCSIGYYSILDGLSFQLMPNAIAWQNNGIMVFMCCSLIAAIQFTRFYLETTDNNPIIERINLVSTICLVIALALIPFTSTPLNLSQTIVVMGLMIIIYLPIVGYIRMKQGCPLAKIFILSWSGGLFATCIAVLAALGFIANFDLTLWTMKIGWSLELALISFGLGHRINLLKEEKGKERQQAIAALSESKAKGEFLARMSHEIRSPLNGVLGMLKLLSDTELNDIQKRYILNIDKAGDALEEVIDDILNYSKIEAGEVNLEHINFNLEQLMLDTIQMFEYKTAEHDLKLTVHIDQDIHPSYLGDPARIRQVLINLLSNAFKFTSTGRIVVQVKLIRNTGSIANIHFEVADTGIGIKEENLHKLFESFKQANNSTTRQFGGTGLGLAICKELTELMGGRIGVESVVDHSSCFWFELPLEMVNSEKSNFLDNSIDLASLPPEETELGDTIIHDLLANEESPPQSHPVSTNISTNTNNLKVLVVEDNEINIKVISGFLNKLSITPDVARNGRLGIDKCISSAQHYDIILMDCEMPVMDGFEAVRAIRLWERENNLHRSRIIALSAHVIQDFRSRASVVGMDGYLAKPLRFEHLKDAIDGNLQLEKVI